MSEHRLPQRGVWQRHGLLAGKRVRLFVERLEQRQLLDASSIAALDLADAASGSLSTGLEVAGLDYPEYVAIGSDGPGAGPLATAGPTGKTPAQIRHAYGFDQLSYSGGAVAADGTGTTIAIVDAFNDPNISSDLQQFDAHFSIPDPPAFSVVNQTGGSTLPANNTTWSNEISLDVEWAHAIAPGADILLVEATNNSTANLNAAAAFAAKQTGVVAVSMSFGGTEYAGEVAADINFRTPAGHSGVTFIASSGDKGAPISEPASSPNVLAVGGTTLNLNSSGNILSELGWSGSGGGISVYESQPSYQSGVVTQSQTARTNPDVAYDANPSTGFPVYNSFANSASTPWAQFGGTSDAAPQWAALIAIADQGRALAGLGPLDGLSQTLPILYTLPSADFHDITTGGSTGTPAYSAGAGYDLVTGLGTPLANKIVPDLIADVTSSVPAVGSTVTALPTSYALNFSLPVDPASVQASGFTVNGIAATSVSLNAADTTATYTFNANPVTTVGLQTMQLAVGAISAAGGSGMTIAGFTGTFTSNVAALATPTINWPSPADILFGTALGSSQLDATATFGGSTVAGTFVYTPGLGTLLNAGSDQTVSLTFTPSNPTSFNPATATISINVDQAPLTVTVADASKDYGAPDPGFTANYQGFVLGQTASVLGGSLTFSTAATAASAVGGYAVSPGGVFSSNYSISFVSGILSVTPAPLLATAGSFTRVYGAANPILTGTIIGLENNDPITAQYTTSAVAASDVGLYPVSAALIDPLNLLANYAVTISAGSLAITPAPLVVSPASVSRLYGAANPSLTGTLTGIENGDAITASFSTAAGPSSAAGPYNITAALSGAKLSDYNVSANTGTLTVSPAPLAVAVANASRVYGAANPIFSVSFQGFVLGQTAAVLAGNLTLSTSATVASGVGNYTISVGGLNASNYALSFTSGTLTVTPAPLMVVAGNPSRRYGVANPILIGTITGLENNDPITALYTTSAGAGSDIGAYPVTVALSDPMNLLGNYAVTASDGTLTITPAPLDVTPTSVARLYGAANPTLTGTLSGVENGDNIAASFTSPAAASSPVGSYSITATLSGAKVSDYTVTANTGTLTVNPALLLVTVSAASKVYGQPNPAFSAGYQGFVLGQSTAALGGSLVFGTAATTASGVGGYVVTASGLTASNYALSFVNGTLTVTPAPLSVTPDDQSRLYGAANPTLSGTISGVENNDPITAVYITTANSSSDVGADPITATLNDPLNRLGNYTVTAGAGTLTITPAPLAVTPASAARLYGAVNPSLMGTITGVENGDSITASFTSTAVASSPVGTYSITAALSGAKLFDYNVTATTGSLTVNPAPLIVTVIAASKVYGQPNPAFGVSYQGFVLDQSPAALGGDLILTTTATATSGVGGYTVTAGGLTSANYDLSFVDGTLTVTPAPLLVSPDNQSRPYGAANPALTGALSGVENSDPISAVYTTAAVAATDIGNYPITATLNDSDSRLGNYTVTINPGTLTITAAPLAATPANAGRLYGAANPALTGTLSGVENGDAITATFSTLADARSATGAYDIDVALSGGKLHDYDVTANTGTLTVNATPLEVSVTNSAKVYGAANPVFSVTYQGFVLGQDASALSGTLGFSTPATSTSGVGDYSVSATGLTASDYAVSFQDGTLTVTPAPLLVIPAALSRDYGADNPALTGTISGLQNADPITAAYATSAIAASEVGVYPISATLNDPADLLGNYTVTIGSGNLTINPAPLSITPAALSRLYGAANPTLTGTIAGLQNDDPITATYATTADGTSDAGLYPISATLSDPMDLLGNYAVTIGAASLTVNPAPLEVTPDSLVKTYGAADPLLTGTLSGVQNGDSLTASYSTMADTASPVGDYDINAVLAGAKLPDYDVTVVPGTLTVEPAPLVLGVNDSSRVYGAANPSFGIRAQGFVLGQDASVLSGTPTFTTSASPSSPVGTYPVTVGGLTGPNYALSFAAGSLAVTPAPLTVTAANASRAYGADNPGLTGTITGLLNGDSLGADYTTPATPASNVGSYPVVATLIDPAHVLGNYTLTSNTGTLAITPASLVVTPDDVVKPYGTTATLSGQVVGQQQGDIIGVTFASDGSPGAANAGNYPITVATVNGANVADYNVIANPAILTVNPASLTVTADDATKVAGQANPAFAAQFTGFVLGQGPDVLTGALSFQTPAGASSAAGQYPIIPGGLQASNYAIAYVPGKLEVTAAPIPVVTVSSVQTAAPIPLVTVSSVQLEPVKLSRKKSLKVIVVDYSGALEPGPAQAPGNYQLATVGKEKRHGTHATRAGKAVAIASATYNAVTQSVTLTPAGKLPTGPLQFTILAAAILDAHGRALAGSGQPGSNYQMTLAG